MGDFENLLDVGLKPSHFRFLIAFVASSVHRETIEVDRLTIPVEAVPYLPPP